MSKYIKLEDAISKIVNTPTRVITDDLTALADRQHEIIDMLADLPTIEVSEDCISKAYLEQEIENHLLSTENLRTEKDEWWNKAFEVMVEIIEDAPSVVPSRTEGAWITACNSYEIICSNCESEAFSEDGEYVKTNFCPNCGARMRG